MSATRPWFVIAGGGTGGHLFPGLAVAEALRAIQEDFEVTVFGTKRPIDEMLTTRRGYELVPQQVRAFPAKFWQWPGFLRAWRQSVKYACHRFNERTPAVILGLGGYGSGPAMTAGIKLGIPTALFNPDAVPGRANRRFAPKVDQVYVQWSDSQNQFGDGTDVRVTGCPIRPEFGKTNRQAGCRALKLDPERPTLLITGASQGARSINETMIELMDLWRVATEWQIVHLTGSADKESCAAKYKEAGVKATVIAFTEQMAHCMAAADIVISRAGASTLAEITAMGLPSVLLPYPFDRKRHQHANAKVLVDAGAAEMIDDTNAPKKNAAKLRDLLRQLMQSEHRRTRMRQAASALGRQTAAAEMAHLLHELARTGR
ncbi:hypothetical protein B7486_10535 [cyanobacterium TDX16]|nr:hypothetical protein B7486_10535 [cyanobacterium TDX16]